MQGITICMSCKHLGVGEPTNQMDEKYPVPACTAFPDGIPIDIYYNGFDHREKFGGEVERSGSAVLYEIDDNPESVTFSRNALNQYVQIRTLMDRFNDAQ